MFSDRFQASLICGNKSDMCIWACRVSGQIGIFPCKCDSYILKSFCLHFAVQKLNISNWVAEYSFSSFVLIKRRSEAEMCCFWNHAECWLLLLLTAARAQTSASVPFISSKPQNKMHTNMSLPLIYNHWWTHLVLITKKPKHRRCDMLYNIYHLSRPLFHSQAVLKNLHRLY